MKLNRKERTVVNNLRSRGITYVLHFQGNHLFIDIGTHHFTFKDTQSVGRNKHNSVYLKKDRRPAKAGMHVFKIKTQTNNPFRKTRLF